VKRVDISLGTPHLALPWSRGPHRERRHCTAAVETWDAEAASCGGERRIRDLRHGSLVTRTGGGATPDSLRAVACQEVPLLPRATHCFVSATVTRDPHHPSGACSVDSSCWSPRHAGTTRRSLSATSHDITWYHHLALLNHPEVYEHLPTGYQGDEAPRLAPQP